jgi:hypothetical protein
MNGGAAYGEEEAKEKMSRAFSLSQSSSGDGL